VLPCLSTFALPIPTHTSHTRKSSLTTPYRVSECTRLVCAKRGLVTWHKGLAWPATGFWYNDAVLYWVDRRQASRRCRLAVNVANRCGTIESGKIVRTGCRQMGFARAVWSDFQGVMSLGMWLEMCVKMLNLELREEGPLLDEIAFTQLLPILRCSPCAPRTRAWEEQGQSSYLTVHRSREHRAYCCAEVCDMLFPSRNPDSVEQWGLQTACSCQKSLAMLSQVMQLCRLLARAALLSAFYVFHRSHTMAAAEHTCICVYIF
jgi:hypothetical protein